MRLTLTREADYAVRAMVWLAQHEAGPANEHLGSRQKAASIAGGTGIPQAFAARVLARLQRSGLLDARAGQQGGYLLARPPSEISLLHVIEAVEGPLQSRECLLRNSNCGANGYCVLHRPWTAAQAALRWELARTPLASVTPQPARVS